MDIKLCRESCIQLLNNKHNELITAGIERFPCRSDFNPDEIVAIKAHLGPWPRALEAAGIKPPRTDDRIEHNREKRIRSKRNRRASNK